MYADREAIDPTAVPWRTRRERCRHDGRIFIGGRTMRAVVFDQYGAPEDVMELVGEREIPQPGPDEVLVRIEHSSVNAADRHMVRANYLIVRLVLGLFRPANKNRILGMDLAGTVQATGKEVKGFQAGDAVVADVRKKFGGGFGEYAVVRAVDLVKKPSGVSFEQAATVPISGQAALMGVLLCEITSGDRVLVNGASGGVGSFAVQIAKAHGAHVTAMCSAEKADAVRSWGADEVIDYNRTSITELKKNAYDAVFDAACFESPGQFAEVLKNDGRYVLVGGSFYNMLRVKAFGRWYARGAQRFRSLAQEVEVTANIESVLDMIAEGRVQPAIQRTVSLVGVPSAIQSLERRAVVGKIVVNNQR
jgi:NADPH:quinone reductase-like Zn-dependent oxidoreductase